MGNVCPCNGCVAPKRHIHCHSTCSEYTGWKAAEDKRKADERKRKEEETAFCSSYRPKRK